MAEVETVMYFSVSFYQTDAYDPSLCRKKQDSASLSPDDQINSLAQSLTTASLRSCGVT